MADPGGGEKYALIVVLGANQAIVPIDKFHSPLPSPSFRVIFAIVEMFFHFVCFILYVYFAAVRSLIVERTAITPAVVQRLTSIRSKILQRDAVSEMGCCE